MKILIGVLLAVLLALGASRWQIYRQDQQLVQRDLDLAEVQGKLDGVTHALDTANDQSRQAVARMDQFDAAVRLLDENARKNQAELTSRLETLKTIVQEPGDSHESVACLDVRVPAQFDRGLR